MAETLIKRSDKVSFMLINDTYHRMTGFTAFSNSKNPKEYSRQYVDEDYEQIDVTGYTPAISASFDQYKGNVVHDYIVNLIDGEKLGNDAVVTICTIDKSQPGTTENSFVTSKRSYAVIGDTEGDSMDAYTYSCNFKNKSEREVGTAVLSSDEKTLVYTAPVSA